MKKFYLMLLFLFSFSTMAFACTGDECSKDSNIGDINDGNKGYILTYYCEKGNESLGKWVDPSTIPALKGDTGAQGLQGIKGNTGTQGLQGIQGVAGTNGINGLNGIDGAQGIQGLKGDKGDKGEDGKDVDPTIVNELRDKDIQLQNNINIVDTNSQNRDKTLQKNINIETKERKQADKQLQSNINEETKDRKQADKTLQHNINKETNERKEADHELKENINCIDKNSKKRDKVLQRNIDNEADTRQYSDTTLQNNITNVDNRHTAWNNQQDAQINTINQVNDRQDRDISNVSNRVSKLEKTQFMIRTELKFIREKHLEVGIYNVYSFTRNVCTEVGLNVVIPIGNSYLDRENKRINARLDRLDKQLGNNTIIEKTLDSNGKLKTIRISDSQIEVNKQF